MNQETFSIKRACTVYFRQGYMPFLEEIYVQGTGKNAFKMNQEKEEKHKQWHPRSSEAGMAMKR